jgi:hypothetical protein
VFASESIEFEFMNRAEGSKTGKIARLKRAPKVKFIFLVLACGLGLAANAATGIDKQQKQIRSMVQDTPTTGYATIRSSTVTPFSGCCSSRLPVGS